MATRPQAKRSGTEINVKRVYDQPDPADGVRVLVDRVWPRGLSKTRAAVDRWMKDLAPSTALRKWFGHDPEKWDEFRRRYRAELTEANDGLADLRNLIRKGRVTLVYAARDTRHNNAVALHEYLTRS